MTPTRPALTPHPPPTPGMSAPPTAQGIAAVSPRGIAKGAAGPLGPPEGPFRAEPKRSPNTFAVAAAGLVIIAVATRIPFMTNTLYAFDSANYALAVRDFYNVAFHQPHPPGYPLYVLFARAIDLVVQDANRSLVLEGIAWSAVAVACSIGLARALFGRTAGLLAGVLLVCT